jgi:hypothetical protein
VGFELPSQDLDSRPLARGARPLNGSRQGEVDGVYRPAQLMGLGWAFASLRASWRAGRRRNRASCAFVLLRLPLKIRFLHGSVGSTPTFGTSENRCGIPEQVSCPVARSGALGKQLSCFR